jgi:hypothetical protein
MQDLSLHILDVVENSVRAKADLIEIRITEDLKLDLLTIEIKDNGAGMDKETQKKVLDPFYTTKTVRRFGLGIPLLAESARAANGNLSIESTIGKGTSIKTTFQHSHIDRRPLGNMKETLMSLILGNPEVDLIYHHKKNGRDVLMDTRQIKSHLKEFPINSMAGMKMVREELKRIEL